MDLMLRLHLRRSGSHPTFKAPKLNLLAMSLNLVILSSLFLVTKTNNFVELSPRFELEVCPPKIKLIILLMTFILCSLIFFLPRSAV